MTPAERDLLTRFLQDLAQSRPGAKDQEAASLISQALNANPDAPYLLVQHTILADQALHAAQARIADLERQLQSGQPPAQGPSFLGGGGQGPWDAQPRAQSTAVPPSPPPYTPPAAGGGVFSSGGGLGSFLRGAATTAAGVAGGEMLFSGLSGLFRPHYGMFGGGGFGGGFGGGYPPEENVTVNNYYDDNGDQGSAGDQGDSSSWDDGSSDDGSNNW
jgi:hypothetical protein